ncbi:MAG: hypothetical protein LBH39_08355 [Clostridiales Family XIII bacterium]|nr:hypothetical protein [Clostridiales Family XIII bacterium]
MPAQTCGQCAAMIPEGENFCPACGTPIYRQDGFEEPGAQQHSDGHGGGQTTDAGSQTVGVGNQTAGAGFGQEGFEKLGAGFGQEGFEKPGAQQRGEGPGGDRPTGSGNQTAGAGFGQEGFEKPHYDQAYAAGGYYPPGYGAPPGYDAPPGYGAPPGQPPPSYVYIYSGLPQDQGPTSAGSYLGHIVLYSLGVIGLVLAIIFMRDTSRTQNFRNFTKAFLILNAVSMAFALIMCLLFYSSLFWFFYRTL